MKIILSRKGFDSSAGGVANPILPDGSLVSLPIPDAEAPYRYRELRHGDRTLGSLVRNLTRERMNGWEKAHLDPDLCRDTVTREPGWRPVFGQSGAAQGHLQGQGVGTGDLFLYFGWFKQTARDGKRLQFKRESPDQHVIFGWLRVGEIIDLNRHEPAPWMKKHPHCFGQRGKHNVLYLAADSLQLPGLDHFDGAGTFPHIRPELVLTAPQRTRRFWKLPSWFHPDGRQSCLTYHYRQEWWTREPDHVILQSAARGQDFVLDCDHYPEALEWASALIKPELPQSPSKR